VCIRLIPVSRVRIPPSPPVVERRDGFGWRAGLSKKAQRPWWPRRSPRDDSPQPRQVRKEATVVDDSGAGVWLAGPPPFRADHVGRGWSRSYRNRLRLGTIGVRPKVVRHVLSGSRP